MANEKIARRYAQAIFDLAKERGIVERVGNDLRAMRSVIEQDAETQRYFLAPIVQREVKMQSFRNAFAGRVDDMSLNSFLLITQKRRESSFSAIVDVYATLALTDRALEPLIITSSRPLGRDEVTSMVARLERTYGKQFDVREQVDARLLGGVRLSMGDRLIDASVEGRLAEFAAALFSKS